MRRRYWAQGNHKGPYKGKREAETSVRERLKDATLLALKVEEEAANQGKWVASRSWKRQQNGFSPQASRRNAVLQTP